jgi:hypothetical protein
VLRRLAPLAALVALVSPAFADVIHLRNGRTIHADRAWVEGTQLVYQKNGGTFGLPRSLVERVDSAPEPTGSPDVRKARERLSSGDAAEAVRLAHAALLEDSTSVAALHVLAQAYLKLGDALSARDAATRALSLDERNPASLALKGDALAALRDRRGAEAEYRKSLLVRPDPEVQKKLDAVVNADARAATGTTGPVFRLRYDGSLNEPLGMAVLRVLSEAHAEYAQRLGGVPEEPITVVLQTEASFQDTRPPLWAAGLNDGTILVPVQGIDAPTPRLVRVLRHELAHSFVAARTAGNCPTWLHEGIAQWLEGGAPDREDAALAKTAREGRLVPLISLEGPFQSLPEPSVSQAYAQSLSAVAFILRRSGEAGVNRLLSALADRLPSEEALPVALALRYPELQESWSAYLRSLDPPTAGQ